MGTLIVLLFILCMLLLVEYIFLRDILSPSFVATATFIFAVLLIIVEYRDLYYQLSFAVCFVVISGLTVFFIIELGIAETARRRCTAPETGVPRELYVAVWKTNFISVFTLLLIYWTYEEVKRIVYLGGFHTGSIINDYKLIASFSTRLSAEEGMSTALTQLSKISMVSAYIFSCLVLHNLILGKRKLLSQIRYIVPIVLWMPLSVLKGGRLELVQYFVACVVFYYVMKQIKGGWRTGASRKIFLSIMKTVPVFFLLFYALKAIMGIGGGGVNIFQYIFNYVGAPLVNLEAYMEHPAAEAAVAGQETFWRIHNALWKLGISEYHFTAHLEFRRIGRNSYLNTYTVFRRLLHDFGYSGMYAAVAACSMIYGFIYHRKIKKIRAGNGYIRLLVYAFLFYPVVLFPAECYITSIWTMGLAVTLVLFPALYIFLIRVRVKVRE